MLTIIPIISAVRKVYMCQKTPEAQDERTQPRSLGSIPCIFTATLNCDNISLNRWANENHCFSAEEQPPF